MDEISDAVIDRELPIIDPHHHFWEDHAVVPRSENSHPFEDIFRLSPTYLGEELFADTTSGHNVIATVYLECSSFYRTSGPEELKPLGEIEKVVQIASSRSRADRPDFYPCLGIVGFADLTLGDGVRSVLELAIQAGDGRLRGIRNIGSWDKDPALLGPVSPRAPAGFYYSPAFRKGFTHLAGLGLSFDAWVLAPQIPDVTDLARTFPDTAIVLDHVGTPLGLGAYHGRLEEDFSQWRDAIRELATCPNVTVKLGGLGMPFSAFPGLGPDHRPRSQVLAALWAPYIETCVEAFGANRAMFESNFPVDRWGANYAQLWNAFKRIAHGTSAEEKQALFAGTAARIYRLDQIADQLRTRPT